MKYSQQESTILEFKRELPQNEQIIKTIIGFCNHKGGRLVIGVDNDGTIIGVDEDKIHGILEYVEKSVYEATHPAIIPLVYTQTIEKKLLLIIEVFPGNNKPYFLKSEGATKGVYIRIGRSTMRADPETIQELTWQSRGRPSDQIPVFQASMQDLDERKISDFLHHKKVPVKSIPAKSTGAFEKLLLNYNFVACEQARLYPTVAGILLFGKNPQHFFPQAYIVCTHFSAPSMTNSKTLATRDFSGTIIEQVEAAFDFVLQRLSRSSVVKGLRRVETLEIPEKALREVLINTIAHRNYHLASPIKIAIFPDRIEVYSSGDFPGPLTNQNLLMGLSFIRNDAICKTLKEMGLIEAFGIGFTTLFESYHAYGLPKPDVIEGENYVKCILPREQATTRSVAQQDIDFEESNIGEKRDGIEGILKLFHTATEITINDLIENLHLTRATAGRRLNELAGKKIIKKLGSGKSTRYILAKK